MQDQRFPALRCAAAAGILAAVGAVVIEKASAQTEPQVRQAVERSIAFLEKEGAAWIKKQQCASCHHVPAMIWALREAQNHGHTINEPALVEAESWALAESNHEHVFPDLPLDKKRSETDYLGPLFMSLAIGANPKHDATAEKARTRLLTHAVSQQDKDGSWHANPGGRPPIHASKYTQTSWLVLALVNPGAAGGKDDPWLAQRQAGIEWLSAHSQDDAQGLALRLLIATKTGRPIAETSALRAPSASARRGSPDPAADITPVINSLLALQDKDGGFSQTKTMKSDAYATGLALYALGTRPTQATSVARQRAQAFLIKTQEPDGSWPMTSRPAEPPPPGPAHDLRPIRYYGAAWAMLGLVKNSAASAEAPSP